MRVRFHEAALAELSWEVRYYANISPKLGERFATVIEQAVAIAAEFPDMGAPHRHGTRRVFPRRFPFSVVYLHRDDELLVLAIAPDNRKPGYWRSRMIQE
ncbi:MAG: type II toxin-antitoxin system RelE/ParE family toxin [Burkholderiaceae bacterium]|jgi:plasmid stabilization system protein ParE